MRASDEGGPLKHRRDHIDRDHPPPTTRTFTTQGIFDDALDLSMIVVGFFFV